MASTTQTESCKSAVALPSDVRPFVHVGNVALIIENTAKVVAELLNLRLVNKTFQSVVDYYLVNVWLDITTHGNIVQAFKLNNLYVLEHIFNAMKHYENVKVNFHKRKKLLTSEIPRYPFYQSFADNKSREVNKLCLRYFEVNNDFCRVKYDHTRIIEVSQDTVLMTAIRQDDISRVGFLIGHGADVNQEVNGKTPLNITYNRAIVRLLISSWANVNWRNKEGVPLLHLIDHDNMTNYLTCPTLNVDATDRKWCFRSDESDEVARSRCRTYQSRCRY